MKIGLRNFGPIREFDIDLEKDFHLLIGQNSIGKSYAITAIYLVIKKLLELRNMRDFSYFGFIEEIMTSDEYSMINRPDKIKDFLASESQKEINISDSLNSDLKFFFEKTFLRELSNSLINTFSSLSNVKNKFSLEDETLIILSIPYIFEITCKVNENDISIKSIISNDKVLLKKSKRVRNNHYGNETSLYIKDDATISVQLMQFSENYLNLCQVKFGVLIRYLTDQISGVHYLPASRSGLYQALSAFGQIIAELSRNRSFLSKKIELPGISEPVSDYFIKLSDIRVSKKNFEEKKLNLIAKEIEDYILGGIVEFNSNTKQLMFSPKRTKLKLELSSTSSMVSELAPIVSYLRYVLTKPRPVIRIRNDGAKQKKSLVMIEEPEAHLHPEVQIKLTEIFEKLVGADIKLIITTHSNFIFNKVNNLIIKKKAGYSDDGFSKDNVNSMVFKNTDHGSVAVPMDTDEFGISDNNFIEPTESLFEEKMSLFSQIEKNEDERHD
ncbi:AAA family ATPase [Pectobacterium versatile]|uniref:AAA family ATPase n=1 Tax=Pectobacterium versatile TaxID=2488639 RepID=UPI002B2413B4|nr:AAA family ATPase [Pectobacterium versatile]